MIILGCWSFTVKSYRTRGAGYGPSEEINSAIHWVTCNPFGGYKESGMGREHGKYGFHELCQIKVISKEK